MYRVEVYATTTDIELVMSALRLAVADVDSRSVAIPSLPVQLGSIVTTSYRKAATIAFRIERQGYTTRITPAFAIPDECIIPSILADTYHKPIR